jgi:hypothetical protein
MLERCPAEYHHVVQRSILQEKHVLTVLAASDVQRVVRVNPASAALVPVDGWSIVPT